MISTGKPIAFRAGTHSVHYLTPDDIPLVQVLLERCHEFWWISEGRGVPADAASATFSDAPPGYDPRRVVVLGVFDPAGRLVGVLTTPPDYPSAGDWYIGLMVLDPDARGCGLGKSVYHAFEAWVGAQGGCRILLLVVDDNPGGRAFWERIGFSPVRVVPPRLNGEKVQGMIELERDLTQPASAC